MYKDFAPVAYNKQQYGKFNVGDSYIVLNTRVGAAIFICFYNLTIYLILQKTGSTFSWNVHFWLGEETSQVSSEIFLQ